MFQPIISARVHPLRQFYEFPCVSANEIEIYCPGNKSRVRQTTAAWRPRGSTPTTSRSSNGGGDTMVDFSEGGGKCETN